MQLHADLLQQLPVVAVSEESFELVALTISTPGQSQTFVTAGRYGNGMPYYQFRLKNGSGSFSSQQVYANKFTTISYDNNLHDKALLRRIAVVHDHSGPLAKWALDDNFVGYYITLVLPRDNRVN